MHYILKLNDPDPDTKLMMKLKKGNSCSSFLSILQVVLTGCELVAACLYLVIKFVK